jgi:hypothetical protein
MGDDCNDELMMTLTAAAASHAGYARTHQDVHISCPTVLPVLEILSATYGHPDNLSKAFDVATQVCARGRNHAALSPLRNEVTQLQLQVQAQERCQYAGRAQRSCCATLNKPPSPLVCRRCRRRRHCRRRRRHLLTALRTNRCALLLSGRAATGCW